MWGNMPGMPPENMPDPRICMMFRIQEINNGYVVEFFDKQQKPVVTFFPFDKAPGIPLYVSQIFLHAAEERG